MNKAKDFATIGTMFSPAIERRIAEQVEAEKQDEPTADKQARKPANKGKK